MGINIVKLADGEVLIDMTSDTVTPETLAEGATAHDASGEKITGTMTAGTGSGSANAVLFTAQTLTDEQKAQARANIGLAVVEPAENDIPKVFFTGTAPTTKAEDELPLVMEYHSKTLSFKDYVTLKVQGDSSAKYPKKNFNLKMFSDADRTEKDKRVFRDWSKTHKYCLKANWIDHTHARNVVNGRLWGQVVRSRSDYAEYPAEYRESANCGAVNGFPVKVYINGIYQGIYTWNIRKDESMFNMDDSTGTQAALIADANNNITLWRESPKIDGTDWTDELNDTVPGVVRTGFENLYSFVMNSTDEEFKTNIGQYFYLSSLIDYYIFVHSIFMMGGFGKSQTMFTYDGAKYLANIYDMDTTWALQWDGSGYYVVNGDVGNYGTDDTSNLLYARLSTLFADEIALRYAELRDSVLSEANIINEFERFMDVISSDLYAEDYASTTAGGAFSDIPSKDTNTLQKLREIIVERLAYCDSNVFASKIVYELPGETYFNGTSDTVVDTGVRLFDKAKDFTIIIDATDDNSVSEWCTVFGVDSTVGGSGLRMLDTGSDSRFYGIKNSSNSDVFTSAVPLYERVKVAITCVDGVISAGYWRKVSGTSVVELTPNPNTFVANDMSLFLGGIRSVEGGSLKGPWTGTIHSFAVYNHAMTAEEIAEKLAF